MDLNISELINISSENIEIKDGVIEFEGNVIFQSTSYEIFGEVAKYRKDINELSLKGMPMRFKIVSKDNVFEGISDTFILKENEINISGNVMIEDDSSTIRGEVIKFNITSGEIKIN